MAHFTSQELISIGKSCIRKDQIRMADRPEGFPRAAWRTENKIHDTSSFSVRDTEFKTRPKRNLTIEASFDASSLYNVRIWTNGANPRVLLNIDLRSDKADLMLSRFEKIEG